MWEKRKHEDVKAFLGKGAEFTGKLVFTGDVRIDGNFEGEIFGQGSMDIGRGALVKGNIKVDNLSIDGEVQGSLIINKKIKIHSSGKLLGELRTPLFIMEEGAVFDGRSHMSEAKEQNNTGDSSA